ncbi:MAG: hypothetical protein WA775_16195 [Psychroserpens sp.]|uniref:hypothetical protein n=1 Tax=Psychroserpens sp. TaxID=2020870 RepID=UPI003CB2C955
MKNIVALIALSLSLILTSCQFSEHIYVNEDGSGTMKFSMDASEMMEMVAEMGGGESTKGIDKAMDSTIVFKDFIDEHRDSILTLSVDEQKKIRALEDFKMPYGHES